MDSHSPEEVKDGEEQNIEFFKQQVLLLREKALLQSSVREQKRLLVENAKLKKDIDELKTQLQEKQRRKAAKLLEISLAEATSSLTTKEPVPSSSSATPMPSSAPLNKKNDGRKRRVTFRAVRSGGQRSSIQALEPELSVMCLDLRVGKILSTLQHPDSDSLCVQKVDLGEATPRTAVSAVIRNAPLEELKECLCVCVCNVRGVRVRGVYSQARVLCAEDSAHMELVVPPGSSQPGDRITFQGYAGEPDSELNPRQRVFENLQSDLRTDGRGVATYKGVAFEVRGKGFCRTASVISGFIK
ncbi:aminoacyl tRNA synthase complex-interacting multifunctional protein 1 [Denticeps clupeoides]|uniref:tRNA-binding domain-containing protein n=1 Tax=Denticeps clupeoides TaxID=299321 RepID=A0AAY4CIG0_9TELE|nr:aminoacyl tRNA synthase complex-interacting multifunctional protein 1-like [Denticeps clupeoides]XP_028824275.1 aminoacyl tRNA synthase complex-interacting multifunctional protein 1-like [Denticeps clupeoides]